MGVLTLAPLPRNPTDTVGFLVSCLSASGRYSYVESTDPAWRRLCRFRPCRRTLLGVPAADAQFARASLAGTVTDGSGLALPGVTVTATNADTGAARVVTTSGNGRYVLNGLTPGRYNLSFELSAFRPVRQDGLQLLVGQEASLNVTLELGGIEETVVVTAEAPVVDVTSKEVGATVTTETMESLPTQSRSSVVPHPQLRNLVELAGAGNFPVGQRRALCDRHLPVPLGLP